MSKNRNDQIKCCWHAIVTWNRQHWPWGTEKWITADAARAALV